MKKIKSGVIIPPIPALPGTRRSRRVARKAAAKAALKAKG